MSAAASPAPAAPIRVAAGTTAGRGGSRRRPAEPGGRRTRSSSFATPTAGCATCPGCPTPTSRSTPVAADTEDGRSVIRHSAAHVLAQAVQDLFPEAKLGIGPPITDGFYYDFDVPRAFTPEDLAALEKRMRRSSRTVSCSTAASTSPRTQAREELADEPYKLELVDDKSGDPDVMEVGGDELTAYDNLNPRTRERIWGDLCRGPHIPTTKYIPAFKLTRSSAAYWRGNQNNASLQRIYGTAWESQEALDRHLELHRGGAAPRPPQARRRARPVQLPRRNRFGPAGVPPQGRHHPPRAGGLLAAQAHRGGLRVRQHPAHHQGAAVPHLGAPRLVRRRHVPADAHRRRVQRGRHRAQAGPGLLPQADELPDALPDLPGARPVLPRTSVAALRVRFGVPLREVRRGARPDPRARHDQDDAHIFCTREQMRDELTSLLRFVLDLLGDYGLDDFYLELSTKDPKKFVGSDEIWEEATDTLAEVAEASGLELVPDPGGAAFYGPKISVQARMRWAAAGRCRPSSWTSTCPERFELEYTAADGSRQRPVMIHRALFGSIERFFGVLTEHYAGAFPAWLAPVQVVGIPVADAHVDVPGRRCRATEGAGDPGRGRRQRRPDGQEDRQPDQPEGAVHAAGGRPRRRGGRGQLPVRRPHPDQRGAARRRGRRHRRSGSPGARMPLPQRNWSTVGAQP